MTGVPIKRGGSDADTHRGNTMWGQREMVAICKPVRGASEEIRLPAP